MDTRSNQASSAPVPFNLTEALRAHFENRIGKP